MSSDVKKLSHGSPSLAFHSVAERTCAASSSFNVSGGAMNCRTRVLLAVEKAAISRRVRATASFVRYWVTPSYEKKTGSLRSGPAAVRPSVSVLSSKSIGA